MKQITAWWLSLAVMLANCDSHNPPRRSDHVHAASALTQRYARSALARWGVRGRAAGGDCRILFVETKIVMEDSMVEALHYGAGAYDVYKGGVEQFSRDRAFRGVAYRDGSGQTWRFGSVDPAERIVPCR